MKQFIRPLVLAAAFFGGTNIAYAADNATLCGSYSSTGEVMASELLPRTMQDFVDMMNGSNPTMLAQITKALSDNLSGSEMMAMAELEDGDAEMLGQAAGQVAMELLFSGSVSGSADVKNQMYASCLRIGAKNIIENQRRANSAIQANMGN